MKIKSIEMYPVDAHGRTLIPVVVETDTGRIGVGEAGLQRRVEAVRGALEHLRPVLIGQDPRRIEHIWQTVFRGGFYPADRVIGSALAAIDMALWDLKAKSYDVPVYELMGGLVRDRIFCYTHNPTVMVEDGKPSESLGADAIKGDPQVQVRTGFGTPVGTYQGDGTLRSNQLIDVARTVEACREHLAAGWRFLRFGPPSKDDLFEPRPAILNLLELIGALRSQLGNEFEFMVDLHGRLNPADAIWFCREVEQYRPYFIEDPLRAEYIHGYEHLRRHTNVPLAVGEQYQNKWDFRELIERDLIDFARIDLAIACGLTEGRKIAGWCETHHVVVAPHNPLGPINLAAGLHLNLGCTAGAIQEMPWQPNRQLPDVFQVSFACEGGALLPPTTPGLGVTFDPEAAKEHYYTKTEPPHYRRLDGSFTNY